MKLCSQHCKASQLFQVCPGELIQRLLRDMITSGYSFSELRCDIETESNSECLTTHVFSSNTAINGECGILTKNVVTMMILMILIIVILLLLQSVWLVMIC